jgi:abortive infection bacteriophage resistance protein
MPTTVTTKPFLTHQQQLDLLKSRGLTVHDDTEALLTLKRVNYYRLSAYSLTLRRRDIFHAGTSFDDILYLYDFDDRLRRIILRFALTVEKSISAYISYYHAEKHGPLGYLNNQHFHDETYHAAFINRLFNQLSKSSEPAIKHHRDDLNNVYPFWVAIEAISFDMVSMFYKNMIISDKKCFSNRYFGDGRLYKNIENWLHCCVNTRNIAAHGARFYNRIYPTKVRYKTGDAGKFNNDTPFAYFYAIFNLLPAEEQKNLFKSYLNHLFSAYPNVDLNELGFPIDWDDILVT